MNKIMKNKKENATECMFFDTEQFFFAMNVKDVRWLWRDLSNGSNSMDTFLRIASETSSVNELWTKSLWYLRYTLYSKVHQRKIRCCSIAGMSKYLFFLLFSH